VVKNHIDSDALKFHLPRFEYKPSKIVYSITNVDIDRSGIVEFADFPFNQIKQD